MSFSEVIAPFALGFTVLIFLVGLNLETINNLLDNLVNTTQQLLRLSATTTVFIVILGLLFIPELKNGFSNTMKVVGEYPSKMLEKVLKP